MPTQRLSAIPPVDPSKTSKEQGKKFAGIAISILAAPFILWGVCILNVVWWGGCRETCKKGSTAECIRIFRDPSREQRGTHAQGRRKSILRFLPSWTRNYDDGSKLDTLTSSDSLTTAEEGLSSTRYQKWPRAQRAHDTNAQLTSSPYASRLPLSQYSPVTFSPKGTSDDGSRQRWRIESHGTTLAGSPLYLSPQITNEISEVSSESSALVLTSKSFRAPRNPAITHATANQTYSPPAIKSSSKHGMAKRWVSEPYGLGGSSAHLITTPKLFPARSLEGPFPPHNSDESLRSGSSTPQQWSSRSGLEQVEVTARENFAQDLRERLMFWAKPLVLNPYTSTGCEYEGTDGRPSSPTMTWLVGRDSAITSRDNFDGGSLKKIFIGESAFPEYNIWSSTSVHQTSIHEVRGRARDEEQPFMSVDSTDTFRSCQSHHSARHDAEGSCSSDGAFQGSCSPRKLRFGSSFPPKKRTSLPPRRAQKLASDLFKTRITTTSEESRVDRTSNIWGVEDNVKAEAEAIQPNFGDFTSSNISDSTLPWESAVHFAITPVCDPHSRIKSLTSSLRGGDRSPQVGSKPIILRSTPEEAFLADLDRRLNRLDYELSPGFRGSRSREATHRYTWQVIPSHYHVLDERSQLVRHDPMRSLELPSRTRITDLLPKKTKPRIEAAALEDHGGEGEPREGVMDTAAWILRRPPIRASLSHSAEQTLLYSDGRNTEPKRLAAWQQFDP